MMALAPLQEETPESLHAISLSLSVTWGQSKKMAVCKPKKWGFSSVNWMGQPLDLGYSASRTLRKQISVVRVTLSMVFCYGSLRPTLTSWCMTFHTSACKCFGPEWHALLFIADYRPKQVIFSIIWLGNILFLGIKKGRKIRYWSMMPKSTMYLILWVLCVFEYLKIMFNLLN